MQQYIMRRALLAIPTLIRVSILIFLVMRVLPGDPLQAMAADDESGQTSYTEEQNEAILTSLGLDKPLYQQYLSWMLDIARGDLGFSFWRDTPIRETIQRRGPITAEIGIFAVIISWTVGLPVGVVGAIWRNSVTDYLSRFTVTFFLAAPSFWLGLGFIVITVIFFTWRPPITLVHLWEDPWRNLPDDLASRVRGGPRDGGNHSQDEPRDAAGGLQGGLCSHPRARRESVSRWSCGVT